MFLDLHKNWEHISENFYVFLTIKILILLMVQLLQINKPVFIHKNKAVWGNWELVMSIWTGMKRYSKG